MKYKFIVLLVANLVVLMTTKVVKAQDEEKKILQILKTQSECWNNGDIGCFMEYYWKSEKLKFIGKSGVTYGWQQTSDNYKKRYPDKKAMGILNFDIRETELISDDAYFVLGKFHLARDEDIGDLEGFFTLIFRKIDGKWLIVSDHTSG